MLHLATDDPLMIHWSSTKIHEGIRQDHEEHHRLLTAENGHSWWVPPKKNRIFNTYEMLRSYEVSTYKHL